MGLAETYGRYVVSATGCVAGVIAATSGVGLLGAAVGCKSALEEQLDFVDQLGCFRQVVLSSTIQGVDTPNSCRFSTPFKQAVNEYFGSPVFTITPDAATATPSPSPINVSSIPPARREQIVSEVDANIQMLTTRFADNAAIYSQWLEEQNRSIALAKYGSIALSVLAVASVGTAIYLGTRSSMNSVGKNV